MTKAQLLKQREVLVQKMCELDNEIENFEFLNLKKDKVLIKAIKDLDNLPIQAERTIQLEVTFIKKFFDKYDLRDGCSQVTEVKCKNINGLSKAEVKVVESFLADQASEFCILDKLGEPLVKRCNELFKIVESKVNDADIEELKERIGL